MTHISKRKAADELNNSTSSKRPQMSSSPNDKVTFIFPGEPEGKTLSVSRPLLSKRAKAIRDAPAKDFITMEATSFDAVKRYLEYIRDPSISLGSQALDFAKSRPDTSSSPPSRLSDVIFLLSQSWIIGRWMQDVSYQNAIMDTLLQQDIRSHSQELQRLSLELVNGPDMQGSELERWFIFGIGATLDGGTFMYDFAYTKWSEHFVRQLLGTTQLRQQFGQALIIPGLKNQEMYRVEEAGDEAVRKSNAQAAQHGIKCSGCGRVGAKRRANITEYPRLMSCECGVVTEQRVPSFDGRG